MSTMHQEARRRQMFMDRVCEARRRLALARDNAQAASYLRDIVVRPSIYRGQGQFYRNQDSDGL